MKILAIQNRMGIGDMIIYLPFIEAISKKYNTKVDILVKENSKASEILRDNKYIGEIINLDRTNKNKKGTHDGIFGSISLAKQLKKYNFEKVFIFNLIPVSEILFLSTLITGSLFTVSPIEFFRKFCAAKIICWFFFLNNGY